MALGIHTIDGCPSNEACHCLGNVVFAAVKAVYQLCITNKMERFRFKSGRAVWFIKEDCYSKNFGSKH